MASICSPRYPNDNSTEKGLNQIRISYSLTQYRILIHILLDPRNCHTVHRVPITQQQSLIVVRGRHCGDLSFFRITAVLL